MIFEAALNANIVASSKCCYSAVSLLNCGEFAFRAKYNICLNKYKVVFKSVCLLQIYVCLMPWVVRLQGQASLYNVNIICLKCSNELKQWQLTVNPVPTGEPVIWKIQQMNALLHFLLSVHFSSSKFCSGLNNFNVVLCSL